MSCVTVTGVFVSVDRDHAEHSCLSVAHLTPRGIQEAYAGRHNGGNSEIYSETVSNAVFGTQNFVITL